MIKVQIRVHLVLKLHQPHWTFGWRLVTWLLHDNDDWHLWPCLLPVISIFLYWRKVFFILELVALLIQIYLLWMKCFHTCIVVRRQYVTSHPHTRKKNRSPHSDQSRIAFLMAPRLLLCLFLTKRYANCVIWEPSITQNSSNSLLRSSLILVSYHTRPDRKYWAPQRRVPIMRYLNGGRGVARFFATVAASNNRNNYL